MVTEDGEIFSGWPLGLEVMNTRLRMSAELESLPTRTVAPFPLHLPSMSFSSFSSSELDTVSTASFFQDRSVSLGRLIGIRPTDKRWLYLPRSTSDRIDENHESISVNPARLDSLDVSKQNTAGRICISLLIGIILKILGSRRNSRR